MANSAPGEQLDSQRIDAVGIHGSDKPASDDSQCPVICDDQHLLRLRRELDEARTQIKKIVCKHLQLF